MDKHGPRDPSGLSGIVALARGSHTSALLSSCISHAKELAARFAFNCCLAQIRKLLLCLSQSASHLFHSRHPYPTPIGRYALFSPPPDEAADSRGHFAALSCPCSQRAARISQWISPTFCELLTPPSYLERRPHRQPGGWRDYGPRWYLAVFPRELPVDCRRRLRDPLWSCHGAARVPDPLPAVPLRLVPLFLYRPRYLLHLYRLHPAPRPHPAHHCRLHHRRYWRHLRCARVHPLD